MSYNKDIEDFNNNFDKLHNFWGIQDYEEEHIEILLHRENQRFHFSFQSPQMNFRSTLVEWMKKIAVMKKLDNSSIHLAVYVLDVFMDSYNITTERLHLVALVSMLLATKFEERDSNIIKVNEMSELVNNKYSVCDYYALEVLILKHLKWNLMLPTAVHFTYYYIEYLINTDDLDKVSPDETADFWFDAKIIALSYLDYVMEDVHLAQAKPSMVGASIMAATRIKLGLNITWPANLNRITGYKLFELKVLVLKLKKKKMDH